MHKGVILLTKANNKDEARNNAVSFLVKFEDIVWDWYKIGGRWSGELNINYEKFYNIIDEKFPKEGTFGRSYNEIEKHLEDYQKIWEELGEVSKNPYARDSYISKDYERVYEDDILPAIECESIIKKWFKDMESQSEEYWSKMMKEKEKEVEEENKGYTMSGYYAGKYSKCKYDEFSFDSNVFDIEEETNCVPKDLTGYYAVMIDMHN